MQSYITLDKGNDVFTTLTDSCEFMNNYIADIGVNLHTQFNQNPIDIEYAKTYNRESSEETEFAKIYNLESSEEDFVFTCDDILDVVNSIDVHKSSGIDYFPTFVLKDCFSVLLDQLTYLFNQSIALGTFPDSWKVATVTRIPKAGHLSQVKNWRPISIIPLIGKINILD